MSRMLESRLARLEGTRDDGTIYVGVPCVCDHADAAARIARARTRAGDMEGKREIVIIEGAWMEPH
ncbi:hypothetical protein H261_19219 [Paramagnetospirillum caucaseum]|uniref:Uncharacterized protein n=1 Tax=Paramagnetospirillum caucaseum TaxID=1244869 RepID=M2ZLW8_9PROT|nr:hypothetical protein [Paramagnetospirillum caucaseum]EME68272.1 hypothetical protein H261_19219 [Paramagnetospirillum caucaseum]